MNTQSSMKCLAIGLFSPVLALSADFDRDITLTRNHILDKGAAPEQKVRSDARNLIDKSAAITRAITKANPSVPEREIPHLAAVSWAAIMKDDPASKVTKEAITAASKALVRVHILSDPPNATVFVDGMKMSNLTNDHYWMKGGAHHLDLKVGEITASRDIQAADKMTPILIKFAPDTSKAQPTGGSASSAESGEAVATPGKP